MELTMYRMRSVLVVAALVLLALAGGGCGLEPLLYIVPSVLSGEQARYEEARRQFDQQVANLPSATVQVVNQTPLGLHVTLNAGRNGPRPPVVFSDYELGHQGPGIERLFIDVQDAYITAGATQLISVKCGELISVAVDILTVARNDPTIPLSDTQFGLTVATGQVALGGLGAAGEQTDLARFVRPAEDGLDCTAQTLLLTIVAADDGTVSGTLTMAE